MFFKMAFLLLSKTPKKTYFNIGFWRYELIFFQWTIEQIVQSEYNLLVVKSSTKGKYGHVYK